MDIWPRLFRRGVGKGQGYALGKHPRSGQMYTWWVTGEHSESQEGRSVFHFSFVSSCCLAASDRIRRLTAHIKGFCSVSLSQNGSTSQRQANVEPTSSQPDVNVNVNVNVNFYRRPDAPPIIPCPRTITQTLKYLLTSSSTSLTRALSRPSFLFIIVDGTFLQNSVPGCSLHSAYAPSDWSLHSPVKEHR